MHTQHHILGRDSAHINRVGVGADFMASTETIRQPRSTKLAHTRKQRLIAAIKKHHGSGAQETPEELLRGMRMVADFLKEHPGQDDLKDPGRVRTPEGVTYEFLTTLEKTHPLVVMIVAEGRRCM